MLHVKYFTIPKSTPSTSPKVDRVELIGEVLERVVILIPSGHVGLTGLQIYYGDYQLIPQPKGEWLKGDNVLLNVPVMFELPEYETALQLRGYNEDDTYDHTFYLYFITVSRETATWQKQFINLFRRLLRGLGF